MTKAKWTYMLRLLKRNPDRIVMDRLGQYLCQFAELLGTENKPVFKGIVKKSTGLRAYIPTEYQQNTQLRILTTKQKPDGKLAKPLREIEAMLTEDEIKDAQLLDQNGNVIYLLNAAKQPSNELVRLHQSSVIDGTVTGVVGADETMNLHIRDHMMRDFRFVVRSEEMARDLLQQFRKGYVRVNAHGWWLRTDEGWVPEVNKCTVDSFEVLDDTSALDVFTQLNTIPGNAWKDIEDPIAIWEDIRGIRP